MIFTYFSSSVTRFLGSVLATLMIVGLVTPSLAQSAWGGKRAARVEVAEINTRVLAGLANVQGRVIEGPRHSVTATTDAITNISAVRLGDLVTSGDVIAIQDSAKLTIKLEKVRANLRETEFKLADSAAELQAEAELLAVYRAQAALLAGKAKRAEGLVANNALSVDAAEMAFNTSMTANISLLNRQSSIARLKAKQKIFRVAIDRIKAEIAQLLTDIKATKLRAEIDGQVTFIADYRRGFAREGEVVAKITDLNSFEIEAEVPVKYISFIENTEIVSAYSLDGNQINITPRVSLPAHNLRSATRTVRFSVIGKLPFILQGDNAVVVIQVPTTSPKPMVIVPKDAVLPVTGGHLVYLAEGNQAKRQLIQIGAAVEDGFIVQKGLMPGQKVVVRGNEQLSDGKKIQVAKTNIVKRNGQAKSKSAQ
ncbi:HlyD family efflux transporter periplasmic adaptor subunit [Candidatus Puniceispirillum sp.]|nr:HlyD family efflux transporter periplasmic adaptor subunit [Candidatus Puniceispirillum sp.]